MNNVSTGDPYKVWLILALIGLITSLVVASIGSYFWREWVVEAMIVSALYFFGLFRFFPWKSVYARAFSIGVFAGMLVSTAGFVLGLR